VLLFNNARTIPIAGGLVRIEADLSVRKSDGSGVLTTLADGIDTRDFLVLPVSKRKILYRIVGGNHSGFYLRDLPPAP
jgi:hypothetical protein